MASGTLIFGAMFALCACGADAVEVAHGPAAAAPDPALARTAADVAMTSLGKRAFPLQGCRLEDMRVMQAEHLAWAAADGKPVCSIIVVPLADGRWEVVVRSGSAVSNPQARVIIAPRAIGVMRIDYAK